MKLTLANTTKLIDAGSGAILDGKQIEQKTAQWQELLRGYGIVESQRTGRVALPKLEREARKGATKGKAS